MSRYFTTVAGRRTRQKHWPTPTVVADAATHRVLAAEVVRAPTHDAPHLIPAVRAAVARAPVDTVLADAGYDAEENHATCRGELGARATVIALNWRGSRKWPRAKYRRQTVRRFRKTPKRSRGRRVYGQRWQVESVFSRGKRRLGAATASVTCANQQTEVLLKVIVHNIMLRVAMVST
ncbi:transposase [bacterium]|nr:transposase [bacterium]